MGTFLTKFAESTFYELRWIRAAVLPALERATSRVTTKDAGGGSNRGGYRPASCICNVSFSTLGVAKHSCYFLEHLTGEVRHSTGPDDPGPLAGTTTIAILGADTLVGRTLYVLLEGYGYQATLLDAYPTGVVDELLDGALWTGPGGVSTPAGHLLILYPYSTILAQFVQYVSTEYYEIVLRLVKRGGERGAIAGTAQTSGHVHI